MCFNLDLSFTTSLTLALEVPTTITVIGRPGSTTSQTQTTSAVQTPTTSPSSSSTSQGTAPTDTPASTSGSSSATGIAVGASIGGVAFILIVLGALYWIRRRRTTVPELHSNESQAPHNDGAKKPEENPEARASELFTEPVFHQPSSVRYELSDGHHQTSR